MDVVFWALVASVAAASCGAFHWYRMWRVANRAYDAARQRADMADSQSAFLRASWKQATEQVSTLAQQLATLRVQHGAAPEERHFEVTEEAEPYDPDLERFLSGIENVDALEALEAEVESMRAGGKSDIDILERIRAGD